MRQNRLQAIIRLIAPYRRRLAGLVALTAILSILAMIPPLLVRAVINHVITGGRRSLLPALGAFMVIVPLLNATCGFLQILGISYIGQKFIMSLRCTIYEHLLQMSPGFHSRHSVGKLVNRLLGDSENVQGLLTVATVQVISDMMCAAFAITVTFALNWRLATPLVLIVVFFVFNYQLNVKRIRRATRGHRGAQDRLAGGIQNRLAADLTVKTFGAEGREHNIFRGQSDTNLELVRESRFAWNTFMMNTMLLRDLGRAVIYFLGCAMVLRDMASYGDVIAFTAYSMQLLVPAVRFSNIAQQVQDVRVSTDRLFDLLDEEPEVRSRRGSVKIDRTRGRIDFDDVVFRYEKTRAVLRHVDFHVQPGETVALVGKTGCGKTTILSLLLRFFDVQGGAIRMDGIDLRDLDLRSLRRQYGIVLQESLLFNVSVAENIRYSFPEATAEQIRNAAKVAEIHKTILSLSRGYDSEVGSRDVQLSVGEKQRISIARAVLADPAIVIMDEATSALDSESERAIQAAMNRFLAGRTSFIVAHRLSTIRNAARIILLDNGKIQETGAHEELMAIPGGAYRDLYDKHVGKGILVDG